MATGCPPAADWPGGLVVIRPYLDKHNPPTVTALPPTSPSNNLVIIRPYLDKNSKPTLLTLPQELRDHIYSFLPLKNKMRHEYANQPRDYAFFPDGWLSETKTQYLNLAATCHALGQDIVKLYWSGNSITNGCNNKKPYKLSLTRQCLSLIRDLYLIVFPAAIDDILWSVTFRLCKEAGTWRVLVGPPSVRDFADSLRQGVQKTQQKMTSLMQPHAKQAESMLKASDCITTEVVEMLENITEEALTGN